MSDSTIVAIVILFGIFLLMSLATVKSVVDGAVRMWNIMDALAGVTLGAITSFYFTNQLKEKEVSTVVAQANAQQIETVQAATKTLV